MALGTLIKSFAKTSVKKIAVKNLMGKNKDDKRRGAKQTMQEEGEYGGGGALVVRPTTSLVPKEVVSPDINPETAGGGTFEEKLVRIKVSVIKIDKVFKDRAKSIKDAASVKEEEEEKKDFSKLENDLEKEKPKDAKKGKKKEKKKKKVGMFGFLGNFFSNLISGFIIVRLIDFIPKLKKIIPPLMVAGEWILNIAGTLLNALVSFVDLGYGAYDNLKGLVKNTFGEEGEKKFEQLAGHLNKFMNVALMVGMLAATSGGGGGPLDLIDNFRRNRRINTRAANINRIRANRLAGVDLTPNQLKKYNQAIRQGAKPEVAARLARQTDQLGFVGKQRKRITDTITNLDIGKRLKNIELPKISLPKISLPKLSLPKFKLPTLPQFKLPKISLPKISLPKLSLPKISLPKLSLPKISLPKINLGGIVEGVSGAVKTSSDWVAKGTVSNWNKLASAGKGISTYINGKVSKWGDDIAKLGAAGKQMVMERILKPVMTFLEPMMSKLTGIGDTITKQLMKIPGFDKIIKVLKKKGATSLFNLGPVLKEIGPKAIDIIGGVINLLFAYDRFAAGDSIGGLIEGASGVLDLSALPPPIGAGFAPGPKISLALDAYMFARDLMPDFFPDFDLKKGEDELVNKVGLGGIKASLDSTLSKLPSLGEITKWIGGKGDDEKENGDSSSGSVSGGNSSTAVLGEDTNSNQADSISEYATYNDPNISGGEGSVEFIPVPGDGENGNNGNQSTNINVSKSKSDQYEDLYASH